MADVFIVGAGPSGLFIAAELLRHGLTCRIIDKSPTTTDKSKAIGIQARTLEVLNYIGIAEDCIANGLKIHHFIQMSHTKKLANISLDLIDSPYPFILSLEQSKTEAILIQHLEKLGCKVEREIELLSFEQTAENIHFTLRNNATQEIANCDSKWLIGCDGAHSTVRKQLNLPFEGISFPQIFSLADVELEWKYPRDAGTVFLNKTGLLFVLPLQGNKRVRLIFQLERANDFLKRNQTLAHGEIPPDILKEPTLEEVAQIVHEYADPKAIIKNPQWTANFSINSRMIGSYKKDRVFLVGDSAHIHSPVGGQGMNTGLQDGFNLGWKLALVHKGLAKSSLLDSYQDERHYVGKKLLNGTERATSFILLRSTFLYYLRNAFISFFASFKAVQRKLLQIISETNICYPPSQWIVQKKNCQVKLKAGIRAPEAPILQQGVKSSIFNILKSSPSFHLLLIDLKHQCINLNSIGSSIESNYGKIVKVHLIVSSSSSSQGNYIQDAQGEVQARYGDLTIYLIRPDGYIGYCGPLTDIEPIKDYLNNLMNSLS